VNCAVVEEERVLEETQKWSVVVSKAMKGE
jgi:hypothetical protein